MLRNVLQNYIKNPITSVICLLLSCSAFATDKPNILAIWGDDIGWFNVSAYNRGMMAYSTPNIDRIANEGVLFTDAYGQNSCTAGRSAFVTGQSPFRTGLTKVSTPGAKEGINKKDPTIAELLKPLGYMTAQFGKNHLGDRDEHLPTNHGFDEFLGNLYHMNAEEEPENFDYPTDPEFKKRFSPRGVIHSFADGRIEDTGPLTKKRMETIDEEITAAALKFIDKAHQAGKPFFIWYNTTRMHVWTHLKPSSEGVTGQGIYADGMVEHDGMVGELLDKLDKLGIAGNTIVMYSTDNGAELFSWPDGGMTPFKGEKNSTWEGGFRVPMLVKWPAKIKAGQVSNEIISMEDWLPTFLAVAGDTNIKEKLLKGHRAGNETYKVHLDGYNFIPYLAGETKQGPRKEMYYFTEAGHLSAIRHDDWKVMVSYNHGYGFDVWREPYTKLRAPLLTNLRRDPYERVKQDSGNYDKWYLERVFIIPYILSKSRDFMLSFREFPPRQSPPNFNLDATLDAIIQSGKQEE